jgi:FkbH-like protein
MYEAEVNSRVESPDTISPGILARFSEYRVQVEARTLLPWGEHCTECASPSCYTTCELYEARSDGECRQFVDGVVRIPNPKGATPYLQKITFRRWAKLWTLGNLDCHSLGAAEFAERLNIVVGSVARVSPFQGDINHRFLRKLAYVRQRHLAERPAGKSSPDYFVCEIYNPSAREVSLTLSIRECRAPVLRRFQRLISAAPGFTREKIPVADINRAASTDGVFEIEIVPNEAEGLTLYFGLLDFVKERPSVTAALESAGPSTATCKCVVWDLDHTLWNGVLIEDGFQGIRIREGVVDVVMELDRRGILQSIASKNNRDDAMAALEKLGLADYFLHPQIHWQPKSSSMAAIAQSLNIGIDTLMFVDDQEFERQEVASVWPQVRVVDTRDVRGIPARPECQVPVTDESRLRRSMYRQQEQRTVLQQAHNGDYIGFLKESGIQVEWARLQESNLPRVYELTQRTNQMNFSGNRYSVDELQRIAGDEALDTYVLRCSDRFGSYGIVGFALLHLQQLRLMDLMFSCRVQGKRVEHGFLAWLLGRHIVGQNRDFLANLRKTPRNAPSAAVFGEMGFEEIETSDGVTTLRYQRDRPIRDDGVIEMRADAG